MSNPPKLQQEYGTLQSNANKTMQEQQDFINNILCTCYLPDCPVNKFWILLFTVQKLCKMWLDARTYMLACTFSVHLPHPNPCFAGSGTFHSPVYSLLGVKVKIPTGNFRQWELSLPGAKVPGNFHSRERMFPETFVLQSDNTRERIMYRTSNLYITHKLTLKPIY